MATRNRAGELERCLGRLAALPERPPVIVVDNASTDATSEVASRFSGVEHIRLEENRGAAARNLGAALATSPYVAFCDDDAAFEPGALRVACGILDTLADVALVAGRILVGGRELDPTSAAMATSPLGAPSLDPAIGGRAVRYVLGFLACAAVVRRAPFLAVGGFADWVLIGGEEELVAIDLAAAGWRLVYAEGVAARHDPSVSRDAEGRRRLVVRNGLLVAGLRRPPGAVLRRARRELGAGAWRERAVLAGMAGALGLAPWLAGRRRRVPAWLEADLRRLEAAPDQDT